MTFLPRKLDSDTIRRSLAVVVKSGAMSPSFNFISIDLPIPYDFRSRTHAWVPGGIRRYLALYFDFRTGSRMRAQLPCTIPYIQQTGDASANRRREQPHPKPIRIPFQQNPQDDNHLQHCSHFANHPRTNFHFTDRHLNDNHASEDQNVAANDGPSEPEWD